MISFTKLANQVIVGITLEAIAEGLVLGMKAGVDPERMIEALDGGRFRFPFSMWP